MRDDRSTIRVFQLRLGATKVPFGQFYGGLDGWQGVSASFRFATDKRHFIMVPIHAYLIEHPQDGLVLVDTGINWRQAHEHGRYYRGMAHYLFDDDEYRLDRAEELPAALSRLGRRPEDVTRVVLTHLHEDHVGGLAYLPGAEVVVSRDEWENRDWRLFGLIPMVYEPSLQPARSVTAVDYDSGPFENFPASHDLTADGAVKLLPTPGHTPGHSCVLVRLGDHDLLVAGDCLYTLRHLANGDVQAFGAGKRVAQHNASIRRLNELRARLPGLIVLPAHNHTAYQSDHLGPGLAQGFLTDEERGRIRDYEHSVFTADGRLRADRVPRYTAGDGPGHVGSVSE